MFTAPREVELPIAQQSAPIRATISVRFGRRMGRASLSPPTAGACVACTSRTRPEPATTNYWFSSVGLKNVERDWSRDGRLIVFSKSRRGSWLVWCS